MGNKYINTKKIMVSCQKKNQYVICGTDTDIGKTLISAFLVRGLNASYWKPIQSGIEGKTDSMMVKKISNVNREKIIPESYIFKTPVSPHWAAEIDNKLINKNSLKLPDIKGPLIIETAGGLLVPLTRDYLQIEQIKNWNLTVILVCKSSLGTLNHTLLSIEALKKRNIKIAGLIINGEKHLDNPKTIMQFSGIPIIAEFPFLKDFCIRNLDILWQELNIQKKLDSILN